MERGKPSCHGKIYWFSPNYGIKRIDEKITKLHINFVVKNKTSRELSHKNFEEERGIEAENFLTSDLVSTTMPRTESSGWGTYCTKKHNQNLKAKVDFSSWKKLLHSKTNCAYKRRVIHNMTLYILLSMFIHTFAYTNVT